MAEASKRVGRARRHRSVRGLRLFDCLRTALSTRLSTTPRLGAASCASGGRCGTAPMRSYPGFHLGSLRTKQPNMDINLTGGDGSTKLLV